MANESNPFDLFAKIQKGAKKDQQARLLTVYVGASLIIVFLALVSLAPQVGERLGTLTIKKQTQQAQAAEASPTLMMSVVPTSITPGQSTVILWSATNAQSCFASGGWSGQRPIRGSETVSPTTTTFYNLRCLGTGAITKSETVTVSSKK